MGFVARRLAALERAHLHDLDIGEETMGRLRAVQQNRLCSVAPLLIFFGLVCSLAVTISFLAHGQGGTILAWFVAVGIYSIHSLHNAGNRNRKPDAESTGLDTLSRLIRMTCVYAVLWSVLPVMTLGIQDFHLSLLIVLVVSSMIGAAAMTLASVPIAAKTYVVVSVAICGVVLLLNRTLESIVAIPVAIGFGLLLVQSVNTNGRAFAGSFLTRTRLREQAATIDIMLKEYEQGGRDWVWEVDGDIAVRRGLDELAAACRLRPEAMARAIMINAVRHPKSAAAEITGLSKLNMMFQKRRIIRDYMVSVTGKDGAKHWFRINGKPQYCDQHLFCGYRGVISDVTEEKQAERRVHFLAHFDPLTGLTNRVSFQENLELAIRDFRSGRSRYVVLYLDLDGFKAVNDMFGHAVGDALLQQVAGRIRDCAGDDDITARIGGDEFAVLVKADDRLCKTEALAKCLIDEIQRPFAIDSNSCSVGVSIGIAEVGIHGVTTAALMRAADIALYRAKQTGKGKVVLFDKQLDAVVREQLHLEDELHRAIEREQFSLNFQPFFRTSECTLAGFEALLRWKHPTLGDVDPARFIPSAERIGIIGELGNWVLSEACRVAAGWPPHLSVAVNVSVPQFHKDGIVTAVRDTLKQTGLDGKRLEIEITEQVFADNPEEILRCMSEIKSLGVTISLDDFGTGYSSLLYLLRFPFDKLKIDRSFVSTATNSASAGDVLETIAILGRKLNLRTTAEGVETAEQLAMVDAVGCTYSQGFLLGKPIREDELAIFILTHSGLDVLPGKCGQRNQATG
ncbi:putative bifunctional diguanylate cyclase/phosphodiesterase [Oricola sp.]|uniref:putative bifunctional diguanylate cyclase/phosphodiesterase n=1 Tax=Oricola sp. TaxID=1979950 RepID=UPI003BADB3CE